ncbi:MAG: PilX N-terminal domain-containing pilus assembly protein, partial [Geopsychrobacter sp.]|nr:PilX N-terminal domain-containing pilus assembly protein [Geopsychrobacter sp.]
MRKKQLIPISEKIQHSIHRSEEGYALIVSLMFMVLLTILGLGATTTTIHELQISSNDSARKSAFYAAEAGR